MVHCAVTNILDLLHSPVKRQAFNSWNIITYSTPYIFCIFNARQKTAYVEATPHSLKILLEKDNCRSWKENTTPEFPYIMIEDIQTG
jgi:hypothetical protein